MEKVLIVSNNIKAIDTLSQLVLSSIRAELFFADTLPDAQNRLLKDEFSIIIIVSLNMDKLSYEFASLCAKTNAGVMLVVKDEPNINVFEDVSKIGVYLFSLSMGRKVFSNALYLLSSIHHRLSNGTTKEKQLQQKIDEIRLIDRAKCLLIQYDQMTEEQAHHFIEKEAMNNRTTRKNIAQIILNNYNL